MMRCSSGSILKRVLVLAGIFGLLGALQPSSSLATPCSDLASAHYKKDPEFDPRAAEILRVHPISKLAHDFRKLKIRLHFNLDGGLEFENRIMGAGYPIQRRTLQGLLQ